MTKPEVRYYKETLKKEKAARPKTIGYQIEEVQLKNRGAKRKGDSATTLILTAKEEKNRKTITKSLGIKENSNKVKTNNLKREKKPAWNK